MKRLTKRQMDIIGAASLDYTGNFGFENAKDNLSLIKKTIIDLAPKKIDPESSAIVVSGGPSLYKQDPAAIIKDMGFKGTIITADASLGYCLRSGLIPDYVVSVDPHRVFIMRWYGDPDLDKREKTDYFKRQELDLTLRSGEEAEKNRNQIMLVNKYGPKMKAIIATSVANNVALRLMDAGMDLYWWNPIYDDWDKTGSFTRRVFEMNGVPCMVGGGNVGTSSWIFAHTVLKIKHVALVGMDFSYPPGTKLYNTQRYYEMKEFFGEDKMEEGYIKIWNPYLKETWFTDPTYDWYTQGFVDMASKAGCITYNCTEGGIIFGKNIKWMKLKDFLRRRKA